MKNHIILLLCLVNVSSYCQTNKAASRWIFAGPQAVEAVFTDTSRPMLHVKYDSLNPTYPFYHADGHSNICDSATGKLLFSTTGMLIHDTTGAIMDNGDHLVDNEYYNYYFYPSSGYTQSSIVLPKGNGGQYYVFIPTLSDSAFDFYLTNNGAGGAVPFDRLQYNVVDMNLNGGLGKVIVKNKMLLQGVAIHKTLMQACRHSNGVDWWLLKQGEYDTNRIYRFLVKADTIEGPFIQEFAEPKYPSYDLTGQYAFSKDGTKFASVQGKGEMNKLFMADFDRCTGELNNPKVINIPIDSTTYPVLDTAGHLDSINAGVCFSPNGQFIYISKRTNIYQYEYQQPDSVLAWHRVQHGADTTLQKFQYYAHLTKGLDDRIYIGNFGGQHRQMSVIDKPDVKGSGCQFCRKCFRLDNVYTGFNGPPNMPDYTLGASGQVCWPLQSVSVREESEAWEIYPNPASTIFYIKNAQGKKKALYNMIGTKLFSTYKDEIDIKKYAKGIYFIRCEGMSKKVIIE
ncbi:MAG: T9SS type A sorting domain-containing protein [Bacteroidetes bacterium]|nr:T9SS type A sorting domain-containing protein [Bacteroidota bacterium]